MTSNMRIPERGTTSPYVLSKIKPYLQSGNVNDESLILAVTKAAAAKRDREDNFLSKSKKVKNASVSAFETGQAESSVLGKLANPLEKSDKRVANMKS